MRVLFVSNVSAAWCGVAEFGRVMAAQLARHARLDVTVWDGHYPAIYEKPYLPVDAATYDLIHVNWHPVTLNHYAPEHFPAGVPLSVFLQDLPPWSTCPLWDRAAIRFATEPYPGVEVLPYPAFTDVEGLGPVVPMTVGWSGVRGDGRDALVDWAEAHRWTVSLPDRWRSTEEEIRRLSTCMLNVLWYTASGRGKSLALMTAAAARRPLVINRSSMFSEAWAYPTEIYQVPIPPVVMPYLPQALQAVFDAWRGGTPRLPETFLTDHSWSRAVTQVRRAWEALC